VSVPAPPQPAASARRRQASALLNPWRQLIAWLSDNPYVQLIERRVGITASGLVLLFAVIAGWIAARLLGGKALFMLDYAGLGVLIFAYAVSRRRPPVKATRSRLPLRAREGQVIPAELTLTARRRVTTVVVEENMDRFLGSQLILPISVLESGKDHTHAYTINPRLRGVYKLGPMTLAWNDPFGLTRGEMKLADEVEILVHPAAELIFDRPLTRQWEDPPIRPPRTKPWPTGFEFYGMRDYVPGDDLRRVVWRAVARTGKLMVRESEQGITDRVIVILDTWKDVHKPGTPSETFETAVRAAAAFGSRHVKDGFSVTLEANHKTLAANLRGTRARLLLLDQLARVEMGPEPLSKAMDRLLTTNRGGAHYIIVTPYIGAKMATRLRLITETGASVLVAVVTWEESDPQTERRAVEMGAEIVRLRPGQSMAGATAHSLGAGIRTAGAGVN
jgi:uncharacterized protein (DUF58 family)